MRMRRLDKEFPVKQLVGALLAIAMCWLLPLSSRAWQFTPDPPPPAAVLQQLAVTLLPCGTPQPPTQTMAPRQAIQTIYCIGNGYPYANDSCTYTFSYGGAFLLTGLPAAGGVYIPDALSSSPSASNFVLVPGQSEQVPVGVTLTTAPLPPKLPATPDFGTSSYYMVFWDNLVSPACLFQPAYSGGAELNYYPVKVIPQLLSVTLIDPVADDLASGGGIVSTPSRLLAATHLVQGAAADGATQVLVRIAGATAGQSLQLTLEDEQGPSADQGSAGYLTDLPPSGADSRSSGGIINVTAVDTGNDSAEAFAVYHAPTDFVRSNADATSKLRTVSLVVADPTSNATTTQPISIVRPPLILLHGLWGHPSDFKGVDGGLAALTNSQSVFDTYEPRFDGYVGVISTNPSYLSAPAAVSGNTLGYEYGANTVLPQIQAAVQAHKAVALILAQGPTAGSIAAVQADVVGHSMGGNVTRTLPQIRGYSDQTNYYQGLVHKLITIDTPHQGSPLAPAILSPSNSCLAGALGNSVGLYAFISVMPNSGAIVTSGAIGDLEPGSSALSAMSASTPTPIATAMIAGQMTPNQLNGAGSSSKAQMLAALCANKFVQDPLALALVRGQWPSVVPSPSDAIVTLASQFDGKPQQSTSANTFPGVHSSGAETLGFRAPTVLDQASGAPAAVIQLLNTPVSDTSIFQLKQ
jgi:pimeloyl-ACP methyl ester carboxylesterase